MLQPKKEKFRRKFRGKMRGNDTRASRLNMGDYALKAMTCGWVTANQIESARKNIVRHTKRKGKLWLRIFPDLSFTQKPAEVKMGGGKGDVVGHVAVVRPGRILFELGGIDEETAREALKRAGAKLSIRTKIISKD